MQCILMISIVVQCIGQCIGINCLYNSIALHYIRIALLMISLDVQCIDYDKLSCVVHWDCIAYDKLLCIAYDKYSCAMQ